MDNQSSAAVEDGGRVFFRDVKPYAIVESLDQLRGPAGDPKRVLPGLPATRASWSSSNVQDSSNASSASGSTLTDNRDRYEEPAHLGW